MPVTAERASPPARTGTPVAAGAALGSRSSDARREKSPATTTTAASADAASIQRRARGRRRRGVAVLGVEAMAGEAAKPPPSAGVRRRAEAPGRPRTCPPCCPRTGWPGRGTCRRTGGRSGRDPVRTLGQGGEVRELRERVGDRRGVGLAEHAEGVRALDGRRDQVVDRQAEQRRDLDVGHVVAEPAAVGIAVELRARGRRSRRERVQDAAAVLVRDRPGRGHVRVEPQLVDRVVVLHGQVERRRPVAGYLNPRRRIAEMSARPVVWACRLAGTPSALPSTIWLSAPTRPGAV